MFTWIMTYFEFNNLIKQCGRLGVNNKTQLEAFLLNM